MHTRLIAGIDLKGPDFIGGWDYVAGLKLLQQRCLSADRWLTSVVFCRTSQSSGEWCPPVSGIGKTTVIEIHWVDNRNCTVTEATKNGVTRVVSSNRRLGCPGLTTISGVAPLMV